VPQAAPLSAELTQLMDEIRELSESIGSLNYYEILGVPPDAPKAVIQGAFFQLAKRWHPDRVPAQVGELKADATRVFSRMSEAHQVLTDDRLRVEYNDVLKEGGASAGEQDEIQAVLRAATAFQKAEVFLKRNNLKAAEEHARTAIENDPSQADYVALYTWIQAQKSDLDGQTLEQLIARLDGAVNSEPENLRSRWYRGQLLKRAGNYDAAMKDFRFIAERDPKHLDATREIRLFEMRRQALRNTPTGARPSSSNPPRPGSVIPPRRPSAPPDKKSALNKDLSGLLGKWFKR
jgi:curved DNA-binding protein CbpA